MHNSEKQQTQNRESIQASGGNMANARERLKIFENILARVGADGDVLGEYAKAVSTLNGFQSYTEMNPPLPPQQPSTIPVTNPSVGGTISPQTGQPSTMPQMP